MSVQNKNECRFVGTIKPNNKYKEGFELKYTAGGTAVLTINLCVTEEFTGADGEQRFKSTYIPVRAWGERAEAWAKSLVLYAVIDILTAFRTSSFTTGSGEKRYEHKFDVLSLKVVDHSTAEASGDASGQPQQRRETTPPATATPPRPQTPARPAQSQPAAPSQSVRQPVQQPARPQPAVRPAAAPAQPQGDSALPPPVVDDIPF